MIHRVKILSYDPRGALSFEHNGAVFAASHDIDAAEAEGLLIVGSSYPLEFTIESDCEVAYLAGPEDQFSRLAGAAVGAKGKVGDRVRACGRIMDYPAHDMIRLEGTTTVAVRLRLPQQSTDYRRGSWLMAEGRLTVALPPADHDEAGLKGSIVE